MPTSFTKEERVMFDDMVEGFDAFLSYGALARKYEPLLPEEMVHTRDRFWVHAPMIGASYDGFDQTSNFDGLTELAVPAQVGFHKSVPKTLSAKNLRNKHALSMYADAAKERLASDVNIALRNRVALEGSVFVKRTVAATGFDDVAIANAAFSEVGVPVGDRVAMVGLRTGVGMASNLAGRSEATDRSSKAYTSGLVASRIANFDVYSDDAPIRLAAATGGATTVNGANQYTEPSAFYTQADGEQVNKDNRYTDVVVTSANYAGIKVGDAFTIAGVNSLHNIEKTDTGQLQTFRVVGKPAANTIRVYPAIIPNTGNTIGGREYQNVTAAPANGATLTWLNTVTAEVNPFFVRGALLLIPGSFTVDPQDGWQTLRATTSNGIAIQYTRQGAINDLSVKARWDIDFGTALLNPQMAGAMMFGQA
jgi:hypothetical protein